MSQRTISRQLLERVLARVQARIRGAGSSGVDLSTTGRTFAARPADPPKRPPHLYLTAGRLRSDLTDGERRRLRRRALTVLLEAYIPTPGDEEGQHSTALDLAQELVDALESEDWALSLEVIPGVNSPEVLSCDADLSPSAAWAAAGRALVSVSVVLAWDVTPS